MADRSTFFSGSSNALPAFNMFSKSPIIRASMSAWACWKFPSGARSRENFPLLRLLQLVFVHWKACLEWIYGRGEGGGGWVLRSSTTKWKKVWDTVTRWLGHRMLFLRSSILQIFRGRMPLKPTCNSCYERQVDIQTSRKGQLLYIEPFTSFAWVFKQKNIWPQAQL